MYSFVVEVLHGAISVALPSVGLAVGRRGGLIQVLIHLCTF